MIKIKKLFMPVFAFSVALSGLNATEAMAMAPKEVKVTLDDKTKTVKTNEKTVAGLLNNFDYDYKSSDEVNHKLSDKISEDMNVVINTEKKVTILLKGKEKEVVTKANTVEEFLKEMNIELAKDDSVIPSLDSTLNDEDKIMIIYTKEGNHVVKKDIPNEVIKEFSFDVPYGKTKVIHKGEKGLLEKTYKRITKNDILISEELISEETVKRPVEKEILIGTKEVVDRKMENSVIKRNNNKLYEGKTRVAREGNQGTERSIYKNNGKKRKLVSKDVIVEPVDKIIEVGTKERPVVKKHSNVNRNTNSSQSTSESSAPQSSAQYTLSQFKFNGVVHWGGKKFTYYSQSVLPGGGLNIPGRHVNSGGYVADGNGYIVVAANRSVGKGAIINTPFGYQGKVYDTCAGCTPNWIDVYVR